jgi:hypothetical protein
MEEDEPLRLLSREEFEKLREDILQSRQTAQSTSTATSTAPSTPTFPSSSSPPSSPNPQATEQIMELGCRILELRKKGYSVYEVSRKLATPMQSVREIPEEFEQALHSEVAHDMQRRADLESARCDALLRTWLPIATGGPVPREKVAKMEPSTLTSIRICRSGLPR